MQQLSADQRQIIEICRTARTLLNVVEQRRLVCIFNALIHVLAAQLLKMGAVLALSVLFRLRQGTLPHKQFAQIAARARNAQAHAADIQLEHLSGFRIAQSDQIAQQQHLALLTGQAQQLALNGSVQIHRRLFFPALSVRNLAQTKDRHGAFAAALALLNVRTDIRRKAQRPDRQAQLHVAMQLAVHLIKRLNGRLPRLLFFSQIAQRILIDARFQPCNQPSKRILIPAEHAFYQTIFVKHALPLQFCRLCQHGIQFFKRV